MLIVELYDLRKEEIDPVLVIAQVKITEEDFKLGCVRVFISAGTLGDIIMSHISASAANKFLFFSEQWAYIFHEEGLIFRCYEAEGFFIELCRVCYTEIYKVSADAQLIDAVADIGEGTVGIFGLNILLHRYYLSASAVLMMQAMPSAILEKPISFGWMQSMVQSFSS